MLREILEKKRLNVVEACPGAAQDILDSEEIGLFSKVEEGQENLEDRELNDFITVDELDTVA